MPTPDLTTAEGILRELWDVRVNREQLSPDVFRARQKAGWQAARRLLDLPTADAEATNGKA
jgi:hypothetical protein